jgi:hypothetical protein
MSSTEKQNQNDSSLLWECFTNWSQTIEKTTKQKTQQKTAETKKLRGEKKDKTIKTKNERSLSSYGNFRFRSIIYFWSCK